MVYDTLLLPTDGSYAAEHAGERGIELAAALGAEVHVLGVIDTGVPAVNSPRQHERLKADAEENIRSLAAEARDRDVEAVTVLRTGSPAEEIVEYADEHADMVVMATEGRGGAERMLLGSIADKVVRTSRVPVTLIREDS